MLALAPGWHWGSLYTVALLAVGLTVLVGVAALSHQHERAFSASVFYVAIGALGAVTLGLLDVAPLDPEADHVLLEHLTELALVVAVFSAGLTVERRIERRSWLSIGTLLVIVMPLTILAIALFGMWAMGLSRSARRCCSARCSRRPTRSSPATSGCRSPAARCSASRGCRCTPRPASTTASRRRSWSSGCSSRRRAAPAGSEAG